MSGDETGSEGKAGAGTWLVFVAGSLAVLFPLWWFKYLPATDLAQHTAIASTLWRIVFEPGGTPFYDAHLQPVPYWLVHVLLVPAAGMLGPFAGSKVVLSAIGLGTFGASWLLMDALRCPPWTRLVGVFAVFDVLFFWGLINTQMGIPFVLFGTWALLQLLRTGRARYAIVAGVSGALAGLSHVYLVPAYMSAWFAYLLVARREAWPKGWGAGFAGLLPLLPAVVAKLVGAESAPQTVGENAILYDSLGELWDQFLYSFAPFQRGFPRWAHVALALGAVVLVGVSLWRGRKNREADPVRRAMLLVLLGWLLLYFATPTGIILGGRFGWGLKFRYFALADAALFALAFGVPLLGRLRRIVPYAVVAPVAGFWVAMMLFFGKADALARPFDDVLARLEPGRTLNVATTYGPVGSSWPPILTCTHAWALAEKGGYDAAVFADQYQPISPLRTFDGQADPSQPLRVGEFDYLLVQELGEPIPEPLDGERVVESGAWRLYRKRP